MLGALLFLALAAWGVAYALVGDKVPRGTTVDGIGIGGLDRAAAASRVAEEMAPRVAEPIGLTLDLPEGPREFAVVPESAGLRVDAAATVDQAGRGSPNPVDLFRALFGQQRLDPVVEVDSARLDAAVARIARQVDRPVREGAIRFAGGRAVAVQPQTGRTLDRTQAAEQLRDAFLADGGPRDLAASEDPPKVGPQEVTRVLRSFATPAMAAPVVLRANGQQIVVPPTTLDDALSVTAGPDGRLTPRLDNAKLLAALKDDIDRVATPARSARYRLSGGRPVLVPAVDGRRLDPARVPPAVFALLPKPAPRVADLPTVVAPAEITTAEAKGLGVKEVVGEFTTRYPTDTEARIVNIHRAADLMDGTFLAPGETFSLNGAVGERTGARGFARGYIIRDGRLRVDYGGGVSQVATTTFNAFYFGGFEHVTHKPHSFYISRYPVGREATVFWPDVDLKFRNDSRYGVLVDASYTRGTVTVRLWSTKRYDIGSVTGQRRNIRPFKTLTDREQGCVEQEGVVGFSITVTRVFRQGGRVLKREPFYTTYNPEDRITCAPGTRALPGLD